MDARNPGGFPVLQGYRGQTPARRPVWLMRQAGRILKPYRDLKERVGSIQRMFKDPDLATLRVAAAFIVSTSSAPAGLAERLRKSGAPPDVLRACVERP